MLHRFPELHSLHPQQIRQQYGGKALGLYEAYKIGLPVPSTWLLSTKDYQTFTESHPDLGTTDWLKTAKAYLKKTLGPSLAGLPDQKYAVRSSCEAEDSANHSFAGVFETELNIPLKDLPEAIASVWSSTMKERALSYQERATPMGVILQPMLEAKFTGICFSKHPSPASLFENGDIVIEFAPASGEAVVGGEITPLRISGNPETLSSTSEMSWVSELLLAVLALKKAYHKEVDIEFGVDANEGFWLLQQRPISKTIPSDTIDLSAYKRMYKRALLCLDIEILIEGCSLFLAPYLEIPLNLERWMIMTTDKEEIQELWVDELINEAILGAVKEKIEHDRGYLARIADRYAHRFEQLTQTNLSPYLERGVPLKQRLFRWFEFITPFGAHYYVPMFMIDALYSLLLREMERIDPENAEKDLFEMARSGISSLSDLLFRELRAPHLTLDRCKKLAEKYGFLKCRQVFEDPYTPQELMSLAKELPPAKEDVPFIEEKYFRDAHVERWFDALKEWMRIRNQEMEYLIHAFLKARPLQLETCNELGIDLEKFWRSRKDLLLAALSDLHKREALHQFPVAGLTIARSRGRTLISPEISILSPFEERTTDLRGRTVFGKGSMEAVVKVAFKPQDIETIAESPAVLVTGMTTPDFIPGIRKSFAALITDEGGILCHAAIVAREIPIPCIVGTGLATSLLKDGMRVRIDFDRGEIEIL